MKKGDIRKQEILDTAEQLFCQKGYEETSIQDILDRLHTSKGSFYHHYISKESLLEGMCSRRAEQIYHAAAEKLNNQKDDVWNLNQLLSGMIPYRDEKLSFLLMLLPIFHSTDGRTVRIYYCDALSEHFRPDVKKYIRNGNEKGNMCCQDPDIMADIILSNINGLWTGICDRIMTYEEMRTETDLTELLRMTECYRLVIERSLSIPYGTLELNEMLSLKTLCEQIHNHWSY